MLSENEAKRKTGGCGKKLNNYFILFLLQSEMENLKRNEAKNSVLYVCLSKQKKAKRILFCFFTLRSGTFFSETSAP
jgi:hypothetical protein